MPPHRAFFERSEQRRSRTAEHLKPNFLRPGLDRRRLEEPRHGCPTCQIACRNKASLRLQSLGASIRPVTASKTGVTVTVRRGAVSVAATVSRILSTLPLESLMPMMFG